jgi:putative SOS response-associated peptidase YedK
MFDLTVPSVPPSYNVAPTHNVLAVRTGDAEEAILLRWGLIPSWSKAKRTIFINARSETLAEKPAFRAAFKKRRCLIFADGYYEWKAVGKQKQPYYFRLKDDSPFVFAGIWETWKGEEEIQSCSIITTGANDLSKAIHDRMPVILRGEDARARIDPDVAEPKSLLALLQPFPAEAMEMFPVSTRVNKVGDNDPSLIAPVEA